MKQKQGMFGWIYFYSIIYYNFWDSLSVSSEAYNYHLEINFVLHNYKKLLSLTADVTATTRCHYPPPATKCHCSPPPFAATGHQLPPHSDTITIEATTICCYIDTTLFTTTCCLYTHFCHHILPPHHHPPQPPAATGHCQHHPLLSSSATAAPPSTPTTCCHSLLPTPPTATHNWQVRHFKLEYFTIFVGNCPNKTFKKYE